MPNSIRVASIDTSRPDYKVVVEVSYNDGSLRRSAKGYWCHVSVIKQTSDNAEMRQLIGPGNKVVMLDAPIKRYTQKTFDWWADYVKSHISNPSTNVEPMLLIRNAIYELAIVADEVNI